MVPRALWYLKVSYVLRMYQTVLVSLTSGDILYTYVKFICLLFDVYLFDICLLFARYLLQLQLTTPAHPLQPGVGGLTFRERSEAPKIYLGKIYSHHSHFCERYHSLSYSKACLDTLNPEFQYSWQLGLQNTFGVQIPLKHILHLVIRLCVIFTSFWEGMKDYTIPPLKTNVDPFPGRLRGILYTKVPRDYVLTELGNTGNVFRCCLLKISI